MRKPTLIPCVWYVKCLMFRCFQNTKPSATTRQKPTNIPSTTKSPKNPYLQKRLDLRNQLSNIRIEIIHPTQVPFLPRKSSHFTQWTPEFQMNPSFATNLPTIFHQVTFVLNSPRHLKAATSAKDCKTIPQRWRAASLSSKRHSARRASPEPNGSMKLSHFGPWNEAVKKLHIFPIKYSSSPKV